MPNIIGSLARLSRPLSGPLEYENNLLPAETALERERQKQEAAQRQAQPQQQEGGGFWKSLGSLGLLAAALSGKPTLRAGASATGAFLRGRRQEQERLAAQEAARKKEADNTQYRRGNDLLSVLARIQSPAAARPLVDELEGLGRGSEATALVGNLTAGQEQAAARKAAAQEDLADRATTALELSRAKSRVANMQERDLVDAVVSNPALFRTLPASQRTALLPKLTARGVDTAALLGEGDDAPDPQLVSTVVSNPFLFGQLSAETQARLIPVLPQDFDYQAALMDPDPGPGSLDQEQANLRRLELARAMVRGKMFRTLDAAVKFIEGGGKSPKPAPRAGGERLPDVDLGAPPAPEGEGAGVDPGVVDAAVEHLRRLPPSEAETQLEQSQSLSPEEKDEVRKRLGLAPAVPRASLLQSLGRLGTAQPASTAVEGR